MLVLKHRERITSEADDSITDGAAPRPAIAPGPGQPTRTTNGN